MSENKHTPGARIQHYLDMRAKFPMKQLGDGLHTIQAGSEFEAELLLSDLVQLKAQYDAMLDALTKIAEDRRVALGGTHRKRINAAISKATGSEE